MYALVCNELVPTAPFSVQEDNESSGKVGRIFAVIASIALPFTAPAIWGSVAASGFLSTGVATAAASTGWLGTITNIVGSAAVGAVGNAALAYAQGARGSAVWQAAGAGAISSGISSFVQGPTTLGHMFGGGAGAAATGTPAATGGINPVTGGAGAVSPSGIASTALPGAPITAGGGPLNLTVPTNANAIQTAPQLNLIQRIGSHLGMQLTDAQSRQVTSALIMAAVNGTNMGSMSDLVAQQKAELDALAVRDRAAYNQRIAEAQKILQAADQLDPQHVGLTAMANVAGIDARFFNTAMHNIAIRQGGQFDAGQAKAYERSGKLQIARDRAKAYTDASLDAFDKQQSLRATGAGLIGPDAAGAENWKMKTDLLAAQQRERSGLLNETFSPFTGSVPSHQGAGSPAPNTQYPEDTFSGFGGLGGNG